MPNVINATSTGNGGLVSTGDDSGILNIQTNETTAITVDASQKTSLVNDATISGLTVGKGGGAVSTNTAVGAAALNNGSLSGGDNFGAGYNSAQGLTTGVRNTILGSQSGQNLTTGSDNILIGYRTVYNAASTGSYNVAVGNQSLYSNTTGIENTAVGYQALNANTTASYNTSVGRNSLYLTTTGTHNTCIGHNSGYNISTGTKNTILGRYDGNQGGVDIRTLSNFIVLSDGDGNPRMVYEGDNNVWSAPQIYNSTTGVGANVYVGSTGRLYRSTSSLKYKTNVQTATFGLVDVLKLRAVTYKGNGLDDSDKTYAGLIAEEVHEAGLTQFVQYADDGTPDALSYGNMVSLLVKSIQELKAINDTQAETINALTARIVALESKP